MRNKSVHRVEGGEGVIGSQTPPSSLVKSIVSSTGGFQVPPKGADCWAPPPGQNPVKPLVRIWRFMAVMTDIETIKRNKKTIKLQNINQKYMRNKLHWLITFCEIHSLPCTIQGRESIRVWFKFKSNNLCINLACLSVCFYPINVKTAEPIGPNFLWDLAWLQ